MVGVIGALTPQSGPAGLGGHDAPMRTCATLTLLSLIPFAASAEPMQRVACAAHEDAFPALIGKPQSEVEAVLRAMPGIRALRAGGPNAPMTTDYREDRATLTVLDGRVTRIVCG